jgi:hypothetical protein
LSATSGHAFVDGAFNEPRWQKQDAPGSLACGALRFLSSAWKSEACVYLHENMMEEITLAKRLGCTCHVSPLRMKLHRLWKRNPGSAEVLEDWLVDVANSRGARIVTRNAPANFLNGPDLSELTNEELVVGLLLPQNRDRPQVLRLAAQLISQEAVDLGELTWLATRERIGFALAELARQACKVEPNHPLWRRIRDKFSAEKPPRSPLVHFTRLAQPVMKNGRVNAEKWMLVS